MHRDDLPGGIKWNRFIRLSTGKSKITCKVRNNELAEVPRPRVHQININKSLRELLGVKAGDFYDFYVSKAPSWGAPIYDLRFNPDRTKRRKALVTTLVIAVAVLGAAGGALYYFL